MRNNKVDKGFEFFYSKLSYRRKLIRTLWIIPIGIISTVFLIIKGNSPFRNKILPLIITLSILIQLIYNYLKWKKDNYNSN